LKARGLVGCHSTICWFLFRGEANFGVAATLDRFGKRGMMGAVSKSSRFKVES
jgi:hypothetical protein